MKVDRQKHNRPVRFTRFARAVLLVTFVFAFWPATMPAAPATPATPATPAAATSKTARPNIYDERSDGAKQITDALASARQQGKRVLLQFGANWCGWCHKLHKLFESDKTVAELLKTNYVVVMIDINKEHNKEVDAKYGRPTRFGLPVLVVLEADGKQLTTKNTSELEQGDHHDPEKVKAFLKEWAGKRRPSA